MSFVLFSNGVGLCSKTLTGFKSGVLLFQQPCVCIRGNFDVEMGTFLYHGGEGSLSPGED